MYLISCYVRIQLDLSPRGKLLVLLRHFHGDAAPPPRALIVETADPVGEWHSLLKVAKQCLMVIL